MNNTDGALSFESTIDNEKFIGAINENERRIKGMSQATVEGGKTMDEAFKRTGQTAEELKDKTGKLTTGMGDFASQSAKQMRESIAVQRFAIRDLQQSIKELQNTYNSSTGKNKADASSALAAAKKDLIAEQATLLAMQKQQIAGNENEEKSQGSLIGGLGKWVIGLASVAAAMKVSKEIMLATEKTTDLFEQGVAAAETAVNYFFRSIASGDWSNFLGGMSKAVKGAIELVGIQDRLERRSLEQEVMGAEAAKKIADLRSGTFDKGVENNDKLIENTRKIIEIQKADYANQASIAKDKYEATRNQIALENKMASDKIEALTFEFSKNEELLEQGARFNTISKQLGTGGKTEYLKKTRPEKYAELQSEMAVLKTEILSAFGITAAEAGTLAENFEKPTLKALKVLADLKKTQVELEAQSLIGSRRDENALAAAINKKETEAAQTAKKAKELADKQSKEQIDYDTEIGRQRLSNQIEIDQQTLNLQKDSAEKSRQQAEIDYRKALLDIANRKTEQLRKMNLVTGGVDEKSGKQTSTYLSALPEEDQKQIDQKVILAEQTKNNTITLINEKEAEKLKEIWQEVTDYRLKGIEKEKAAVKEHYDAMEKAAKKAGDTAALAAIPILRNNANTEIDNKYALQRIDFEEKIEKQGNQIKASGFDHEARLMKLNFDTWLKYNNQRIALLKKSNDPKDQQEAQLIQGDIDVANTEKKLRLQDDILNSARQFTGELIEQLGLSEQESKQLQGMADVLMNLAVGNYVGAAFGAASTVLTAIMGQEKKDPTAKALENVNALLEKQSAILSNLAGSNYFELAAKQYADYGKVIDLNNSKLRQSYIYSKEAYELWVKAKDGGAKIDMLQFLKQQGYSEIDTEGWSPQNFIDAYTEGSIGLDNQQIEWVQAIVELQKQRAELLQETFRTALGFDASDVSDSILQGIEDGLKLSENNLGGFAETFGELMKKALMQSVIDSMNLDLTNTFLPEYQKAMSDLILTDEERANLESIYRTMIEKGQIDVDNIESITARYGSFSKSSAPTGITASASAEAVSAMVGQAMAMRVDLKEQGVHLVNLRELGLQQVNILDASLFQLMRIGKNTDNLEQLKPIKDTLDSMDRTLKEKL